MKRNKTIKVYKYICPKCESKHLTEKEVIADFVESGECNRCQKNPATRPNFTLKSVAKE